MRAGRQVECVRRALEDAVALPDAPPLMVSGGDGTVPGEEHQADLLAVRATLDGPAVGEPQYLESDVLPAGRLRAHLYDAAVLIRLLLAGHEQFAHAPTLLSRGSDAPLVGLWRIPRGRRLRSPSRRPPQRAHPRRTRRSGQSRSGPRGRG